MFEKFGWVLRMDGVRNEEVLSRAEIKNELTSIVD